MKHIILITILLLICACSESNDTIELNKNYFFNKDITYWNMQNNNGNNAYFQALENTEISLAMRFWDTSESSRINIIATPINFVYWENGMKKQQFYALINHNNTLYFATKKHPLIANYNLDFYIYLFTIPNEIPNQNHKEFDSIEYPYGATTWKMNYNAEWIINSIASDTNKIYDVRYTASNNMATSPTYFEDFSFMEGYGFYTYMGYNLIKD